MTGRTLAFASLMALLVAAPLAGCGKMGELERPGPLTGAGRASTRAADEQNRQATDPSRPVDTVDPRDRATDPAPARTIPLEGNSGSSGAASSGPAGALPNPYANPR
jgi:predicted small lipoprotein YifL